MNEDPRSYNLPQITALRPEQLDNVARALISLTRELCVLTDRVAVLETVLAQQGTDIREAVDTHQPDAELQARIDAQVSRVVGEVLGALYEH